MPPSKEFLKRIKKSGYEYVIKKVSVKGSKIKKVLIGPYSTKDIAKKELLKVKRNIKKDAFIIRIK